MRLRNAAYFWARQQCKPKKAAAVPRLSAAQDRLFQIYLGVPSFSFAPESGRYILWRGHCIREASNPTPHFRGRNDYAPSSPRHSVGVNAGGGHAGVDVPPGSTRRLTGRGRRSCREKSRTEKG